MVVANKKIILKICTYKKNNFIFHFYSQNSMLKSYARRNIFTLKNEFTLKTCTYKKKGFFFSFLLSKLYAKKLCHKKYIYTQKWIYTQNLYLQKNEFYFLEGGDTQTITIIFFHFYSQNSTQDAIPQEIYLYSKMNLYSKLVLTKKWILFFFHFYF